MPDQPNLLILTVGTGTAGKYSNLAEGLRRTVELLAPRRFWLLPSLAEDSQAVADLVAEGFGGFAPWTPSARYRPLPEPDDLESCRQVIREAVRAARAELRPGERLFINPTSGTKQMTAAAALAALDENIGDIVFTVGERADGVVKTGTERLASFDASIYFRERDFNTAADLFASGGFYAAARILEPHALALKKARDTAMMCHHWQRLDYQKAASAASGLDENLRRAFARRADAVKTGRPVAEVLADILLWARFAYQHKDYDETVRLAYKAIEYAAKCRLAEQYHLVPDKHGFYEPDQVYALRPDFVTLFSSDNQMLTLGLKNLMTILEKLGDELGKSWQSDGGNIRQAKTRNENTHSIRPVQEHEARSFLERVGDVMNQCFTLNPLTLPTALPYDSR